jgi:hypothetical protein
MLDMLGDRHSAVPAPCFRPSATVAASDPLHGLDGFAVRAKVVDQHLDIDVEVSVTGGAAGMNAVGRGEGAESIGEGFPERHFRSLCVPHTWNRGADGKSSRLGALDGEFELPDLTAIGSGEGGIPDVAERAGRPLAIFRVQGDLGHVGID